MSRYLCPARLPAAPQLIVYMTRLQPEGERLFGDYLNRVPVV
jgi:hypothetical protein